MRSMNILELVLVVAASTQSLGQLTSWVTKPTTTTEPSFLSVEPATKAIAVIGEKTPMGIFRKGFAAYERRVNVFINNMRRVYMNMYSDNGKFIEDLGKYEDMLPKNETNSVPQKYRQKCYCESQYWSPCPQRCMDSCRLDHEHFNYYLDKDNCTEFMKEQAPYIEGCWCYDGSNVRCDGGELHNCYEWKTETPKENVCMEFTPNRTLIETSYLTFSALLMEPFKKLVRDLDFQLAYLKQSVEMAYILNSLTLQNCADFNENPCHPEAMEAMSNKLTYFKQFQRNLTLVMIKTQNQAEEAFKNLNNHKEQTLTQMTETLKNYTCCLKGLSFTVTDNDCYPKPTESTLVTTSPITPEVEQDIPITHGETQQCLDNGNFRCENKRCIPANYVCDGDDDCGDASDEACKQNKMATTVSTPYIPEEEQDNQLTYEALLCLEERKFLCKNENCIPANFVCDGEDDCGDDSDEKHCPFIL